jgi:hypothetical protein
VAERLVEKPQRSNLFESVWGKTTEKAGERSASEDTVRALKTDSGNPRERVEPVLATAVPATLEPRTVEILKSGVIDGMAYTLYTDGSIEAQLSQGVMRFDSIDALRAHLENNP